jgi:predicted ABC-type transport system involved in lysophospholipase L1 biosynthesis ATPase subunit
MVLGGIDSIGTDDVGTQLLQVGNVTLAAVNIGQRIGVVGVLGSCAVGLVLLCTGLVSGSIAGISLGHTLVGNTANEAEAGQSLNDDAGGSDRQTYNSVPLLE